MKNLLIFGFLMFFFASCTGDLNTSKKFNPTPYKYSVQIPERDFALNIPEDNNMTVEGVELGKLLFNEKLLSSDGQLSCTSCHDPGKAFASNNRFDKGFKGIEMKSNTMSLENMVFNTHVGWKGKFTSLEEAIFHTIQDPNEFNEKWDNVILKLKDAGYSNKFFDAFGKTDFTSEHVTKAIAQYLRSNVSVNSKFDRAYYYNDPEARFTPLESQGFELFMSEVGDCFHCHRVGPFTDNRMHNNGLDAKPEPGYAEVTKDENDRGKFKTVSLRNIALTAPYMHDGRYKTLEEVLDFYDGHVQFSPTLDPNMLHLGPIELTAQEKKALIAFLHTLTDEKYKD
ncbi:MAG: cytochrome-c peroxidase [Deltaproteobacteria bacterium]